MGGQYFLTTAVGQPISSAVVLFMFRFQTVFTCHVHQPTSLNSRGYVVHASDSTRQPTPHTLRVPIPPTKTSAFFGISLGTKQWLRFPVAKEAHVDLLLLRQLISQDDAVTFKAPRENLVLRDTKRNTTHFRGSPKQKHTHTT